MADGEKIQQDEIEKLVQQAGDASSNEPSDQGSGTDEAGDGSNAPSEAIQDAAAALDAAASNASPAGIGALDFSDLPPVSFESDRPSTTTVDDVQLLLSQAEEAISSVSDDSPRSNPHAQPFRLTELNGSPASAEQATIDLLRDVELDLRIELGRTCLPLEDVLKLKRGAVVSLDKLAGDPVDIYVNQRLVARGEVLVLNDNFCVRVAELLSGDDV